MLALGKLLELTLAGREPAEKTQLTVDGVRMRWLAEGALEVRPPEARDNGTDLLLSAGIHGNETAPIELLDALIHAIARGDVDAALLPGGDGYEDFRSTASSEVAGREDSTNLSLIHI